MLDSYQLYISNSCSGCSRIISFLNEENIKIKTINVDSECIDLEIPIMIFPALIKENKLISYGAKDIIAHLKK